MFQLTITHQDSKINIVLVYALIHFTLSNLMLVKKKDELNYPLLTDKIKFMEIRLY